MKSQREDRAQAAVAARPDVQVILHTVPLRAIPIQGSTNSYAWHPADEEPGRQLANLLRDGWSVQSTVLAQGAGYGTGLIYTLIRAVAPEAPKREPIQCR